MRRYALCFTLLAPLWLPRPAPAQWTNDPYNGMVTISNYEDDDDDSRLVHLPNGNTIICWNWDEDYEDPLKLYYQVLNPFGTFLLPPNGLPVIEGEHQFGWGTTFLVADGQGGAITVFGDKRDGSEDVYGQRFDSLGNRMWGPMGLPLAVWSGPTDDAVTGLELISDSSGDFFACSVVSINLGEEFDLYVQKFQADGTALWGSYGVPLCVGVPGPQGPVQAVPDLEGGVICAWDDFRHSMLYPQIYLQHLDEDGQPLLAISGIPLRHRTGSVAYGYVWEGVSDGEMGGVWSFQDPASIAAFYLIRVNGQGRTLWEWSNDREYSRGFGQMLLHAADATIWLYDVEARIIGQSGKHYLYRFDHQGHSLFPPDGLPLGGWMAPTSDGVITVSSIWSQAIGTQILARRIDGEGLLVWQSYLALGEWSNGPVFGIDATAPDGADGAVISFIDARNWALPTGYDMLAQRVQWNGQLGNPPVPVESHPGELTGMVGNTVRYFLPASGSVRVELFDVLGRKVSTIMEANQSAGQHEAAFENRLPASGIYLLKLTTPFEVKIFKVVVVR